MRRRATKKTWQKAVIVVIGLGLVASACGDDGGGGSEKAAKAKAEPTAGTWKTWVLSSPTEIAVPPPPAAGSAQEKAEDQEIKDLAAKRTPEVKDIVRKWAAEGSPVSTPWVDMNLEFVSAREKDPPLSSRGYALMSVAVYDALVATWHYKYEYNRKAPDVAERLVEPGPDPSYPSEHAAIAGAAARVLAYLFPERPALRLDEAADQAADSRVEAGVSRRSDVEAGLDLGHKVADKVIAFAKSDGSAAPCNKKAPGSAPRYWAPPAGSVAKPVQPCAGDWKTWVMTAGNQFRPGPPPIFGSAEFLAQAREEVATKAALTEDQKKAATFWAGGQGTPLPAGVWMNVLLAYLRNELPTEPKSERTLALAAVAMADAGVASWDAKFTYWDPRPQNGVRDSGVDKNWVSFIDTPFFPSYISGHATYSGAAAEVLSYLFPKDAADFHAKAEEASNSRLWGGIHWRSDNETGMAVGKKIGQLVVERAKTDGGGTG